MRRRAPQQGRVVKRRRTGNTFRRQQRTGMMRTGGYTRYTRPGELKFFDTDHTVSTVVPTGTITDSTLNAMVAGTGESQRVGRCIYVKGVYIKGSIRLGSNAVLADSSNRCRIIMYIDKQANGAAATAADILDATGASVSIDSFRNLENASRFRILSDKIVHIQASVGGNGTTDAIGEVLRTFRIAKTFRNPLKIEFNAVGGGTVADVTSNNIGMLMVTAETSATPIQTLYRARLRYTD